ncbi:MAG TPA: hypothetical protein VLH85_05995 [Levilinea sp.]|nr:hypothetical protein [Levilinea sp.]
MKTILSKQTSAALLGLLFILPFPAGAFVAARPLFQKGTGGKRKFYLVNGVTAVLLLIVFTLLVIELGTEFYRCDVLLIPNCD